MKPIFTSTLLHALILVGAWLLQPSPADLEAKKQKATPMEVTLLNPAQVVAEKPPTTAVKTKIAVKTKKRFRKVRPSAKISPQKATSLPPAEAPQNVTQSAQIPTTYVQALNLFISRNQHYPRRARRLKQTGIVEVRFHITQGGEFRHVHLHQGCNHQTLNQAAIKLIEKLGRFKPLPKNLGAGQNFVVPIKYRIRRGS